MPQQAFRIYGNTYYVGTHGLSSVLITSGTGHVLIDGALPESAPLIAANIRSLGFRIEDVKLILNSHAHFDHAGGIAELQRLSGARVAASQWTADVMRKGEVPRDDPQFGALRPIARVARVETLKDNETLNAGAVSVTAHLTPGHTPGGTQLDLALVRKGPLSKPGLRRQPDTRIGQRLPVQSQRRISTCRGLRAKLLVSREHSLRHPHYAAPRSLGPLAASGATGRQAGCSD